MRQYEIREVVTDALIVIHSSVDQTEATAEAMWWTAETGVVCYAREI